MLIVFLLNILCVDIRFPLPIRSGVVETVVVGAVVAGNSETKNTKLSKRI